MRISIELFLLDNWMMNVLMLRLGGALLGMRPRQWAMQAAAAFGAGYALLSMTLLPMLAGLLPKLLLGGLMALPLTEAPRTYWKALLGLYLSACLMGGIMLALAMLFGGSFRGGAFVCTVPVRIALLAACCCALLPRVVAAMLGALRRRALKVKLVVEFDDRTLELSALVDTGNLLTEPISGLPVIVLRPGLLPVQAGRPVPFRTVDGGGMLYAVRPRDVRVFQGYWHRVDAMVAESKYGLRSADAIVGAGILTEERWCMHAQTKEDAGTDLPAPDRRQTEGAMVHPLGGDAAAAVWAGGGTGVDRTTDA